MAGYEPDTELETLRQKALWTVNEMKIYKKNSDTMKILQARLERINGEWEQIHKDRNPNSYIPVLILND